MNECLFVENLTKCFGSVVANEQVCFEVRPGEIHCLLGENGAGKSTLTKCIFGAYRPDSGIIRFQGEVIDHNSPDEAIRKGIGMVQQHFTLAQPLTVIENIIVGTPGATLLLNLKAKEKELKELCDNYGVELDLYAKIWDLSVGQQQWVEILKALYLKAKLLILDEPTAVLTPQESEKLFRILKQMASEGLTIILISHKLNEVLQSDRVTVLRKGRVVATVNTRETSKQDLTNMMVGREVIFDFEKQSLDQGKPVVEVQNVFQKCDWGGNTLRDVSFTIHEHEIVGIAGVAGNGQKELFETLVGIRQPDEGQILLEGKDISQTTPMEIMKLGVGHIPQDRYHEGLVGDFSIADNLILGRQHHPDYLHGPFLNQPEIRKFAQSCMDEFDIAAPSIETNVENLSGGNAQKVILAREFWQSSKVLLANQPTRGLDVGIIEYVHQQLLKKRAEGYAILLASEELDDIFSLSDTILVMFKGQIVGRFKTEEADLQTIGLLMAGQKEVESASKGLS